MFKKYLPVCCLLVFGFLLDGTKVGACIPGDLYSECTWQFSESVSVCLLPGDGMNYRAYESRGGVVYETAALRFPVLDDFLQPRPNFLLAGPLPIVGGPPSVCDGVATDLMTDAAGWMTIPFAGGGHRGPGEDTGLRIYLSSCPELVFRLQPMIYFNSPDINGDLAVNLSDVPLFASDFYGEYDYRSDFNWDGSVNLSDVVIIATSLGAGCP